MTTASIMHSATFPALADNREECTNFKTAIQVDAIYSLERRVDPDVVEATSGWPCRQLQTFTFSFSLIAAVNLNLLGKSSRHL